MATAPHSFTALQDLSPAVAEWVEQVRRLTTPDKVQWCDGSPAELTRLKQGLEKTGELKQLNQSTFPGCHIAYSHPSDVARVEHLTFICTRNKEDAGPNNHWMDPAEAHGKMRELFKGCMKGRTLVRRALLHGPHRLALFALWRGDHRQRLRGHQHVDHDAHGARGPRAHRARRRKFVKGLHSIGELDPNRRFIMHFPEELSIESYGSGYGGNALLGKKCHALRIASWQARDEGWLAEHMLIVGIENPQGETHYIAAAFPSACGKTNLAMLIPPESMPGWKIWTVGDDIAWLHPGPDGRLYAINPEAGYFGVVPGTNRATNRNAFDMIHRDTLFTNVALTADNEPWWEGRKLNTPVLDWQGKPFDPAERRRLGASEFALHGIGHEQSYLLTAQRGPDGRANLGASCSAAGGAKSRRWFTRRATGSTAWWSAHRWRPKPLRRPRAPSGVVRRDPMAMKPFAGYNFGDYWRHWLAVGKRAQESAAPVPRELVPARCQAGKFLWPGYGDNLRVMEWIIKRCAGAVGADESPIGYLPRATDLNLKGVGRERGNHAELLAVQPAAWRKEAAEMREYLKEFGARAPAEMSAELDEIEKRLG